MAALTGWLRGTWCPTAGARQRAERETDNADAVFRRMLTGPARTRGAVRPALGFTTYLRRLTGRTLALALDGQRLPPAALRCCKSC